MKRISLMVIGLILVAGMFTQSFSLLQVRGVYSGYAKESGLGIGIDFPLIPFFPTSFYLSKMSDVNVVISSPFAAGGKTFAAGTVKANTMVAELQMGIPFTAVTGVDIGVNLLVDMLGVQDNTGTIVGGVPGNGYLGVYGNYKQDLLPLVSWYAQLGYLLKIIDGQKTADTTFGTNFINLGPIDKSGIFWRLGFSVGF